MTLHGIETKMEIWYQFSWEPGYWAMGSSCSCCFHWYCMVLEKYDGDMVPILSGGYWAAQAQAMAVSASGAVETCDSCPRICHTATACCNHFLRIKKNSFYFPILKCSAARLVWVVSIKPACRLSDKCK